MPNFEHRRSRLTQALLRICGLGAIGLLILGSARISKVAPEDLHRPTPIPDRIVLSWTGDPATTQSVNWRTSVNVAQNWAEIAESEDGPGFPKQARQVKAERQGLKSNLGEATYHTAHFRNLKPATIYAYRVGDGANWSEWNQFRTAASGPEPLTFLYFGDAQNDVFSMWSRVIREGFRTAPKAGFILHAGDLINRANRDEEWGEWFRAAGWINATIPILPVPGNHEYERGEGGRAVSRHWRPQFALPQNGPKGLEETCYWLDVQGVRVVGLNSNERQEEQANWLDEVLSRNPARWTVITFHHPIYSSARGRDNAKLRSLWQPVFDKHKVDLVLQGHDHTYARSNLVTGVNTRGGNDGTVYVVSVSGPKMYGLDRDPWMARVAQDTQLYQAIHIDGGRLVYESRTPRGILYDAFELRKRNGAPNELINRIPADVPERVRGAAAAAG
jgi:hypothetical protein